MLEIEVAMKKEIKTKKEKVHKWLEGKLVVEKEYREKMKKRKEELKNVYSPE